MKPNARSHSIAILKVYNADLVERYSNPEIPAVRMHMEFNPRRIIRLFLSLAATPRIKV